MTNTDRIIEDFSKTAIELMEAFAEKQDLEFEGFVGDDPAGVACFSWSYFFNLSEIYLDLSTNQPKGLIKEWNAEITEQRLNGNEKYINYFHWTLGKRYD